MGNWMQLPSFAVELPALLAQAKAPLSTEFQTAAPPALDLATVALATGSVALVLLVALISSSLLSAGREKHRNDPRGLLKQLCTAHGFSRGQQRLLLKAARILEVAHPGRFFLEPGLLAEAANHPALAARRGELLEIAGELFAPAG
jgi:hypothetical protein